MSQSISGLSTIDSDILYLRNKDNFKLLSIQGDSVEPTTIEVDTLNNVITSHFKNKLHYNSHNKPVNFILSLSNESGEGEHKIFDYIRQSATIKYTNNVIYGMS